MTRTAATGMLAVLLAPTLAVPIAAAQTKPVQPKINLPGSSGGNADASEEVADGTAAPEDQPAPRIRR
jgi:hypothetical protein